MYIFEINRSLSQFRYFGSLAEQTCLTSVKSFSPDRPFCQQKHINSLDRNMPYQDSVKKESYWFATNYKAYFGHVHSYTSDVRAPKAKRATAANAFAYFNPKGRIGWGFFERGWYTVKGAPFPVLRNHRVEKSPVGVLAYGFSFSPADDGCRVLHRKNLAPHYRRFTLRQFFIEKRQALVAFRNNYTSSKMRPVFRSDYHIPDEMFPNGRYWFSPSLSAFSIGRFFLKETAERRGRRSKYTRPYINVRDGAASSNMKSILKPHVRTSGRYSRNKRLLGRGLNARAIEARLRAMQIPISFQKKEVSGYLKYIRHPVTTKRPTWAQQASLSVYLARRAASSGRSVSYGWYGDHFDMFFKADYKKTSSRLVMKFLRKATRGVKTVKKKFADYSGWRERKWHRRLSCPQFTYFRYIFKHLRVFDKSSKLAKIYVSRNQRYSSINRRGKKRLVKKYRRLRNVSIRTIASKSKRRV